MSRLVRFSAFSLCPRSLALSDDIFSFLIPMPTMHRLACFRDDVIFFVYLYQRWIYPTDHSRTIKADTDDDQRAEGKSGGEGQAPLLAQGEALPLPLLAATADGAAERSKDENSAAPPAAAATTAGDSDVDVATDATSSTAEGAAESVLTRRHAAATAAAAASD